VLTELESAVAVPPTGFVREYVLHGMKQTTAPLVYHLGVGLTILASTCPLNYGAHYAGSLRANQFCLLVGRSGEDQKSSALAIGRELLFEAAAPLVGDFPGSPEGLIDSLARAPSQMIPISEFGKFLASAQRGYFEPIKTLLADLWDSQPIQRTKANNRVIRVDNPRLSIVAACSIPYLEKHTLAEDWSGGFMGRWCVLYGKRERTNPDPIGDRTKIPWLVDQLRVRATTPAAGWCVGLDEGAKRLWRDWFFDISNRRLPDNIVGIRARAPTIARKVALLYGWDYGPAIMGAPWRISIDLLEPAIAFTELHIKSLVGLSDVIAEHKDARLRRSVLTAIENHDGLATLGEILSRLKMRKRPIVETLDALAEEGRVSRVKTPVGYAYALRGVASMDSGASGIGSR
jgi:hypothetical protein